MGKDKYKDKPAREGKQGDALFQARKARYAAFGGKGPGSAHGRMWGDVDQTVLSNFIEAVTSEGNAVTFARTRDGGMMSLTVFDGDDKIRKYHDDPADMSALLDDFLDLKSLEDNQGNDGASAAQVKA